MAVSTDGVLLGAWCQVEQAHHILDIGTGTGLLALMCAQRNSLAKITALELDAYAVQAASDNFSQSPWAARLSLIHADAQTVALDEQYDVIICNPPYFNSGEHAQTTQRATARHTHTLNHQCLLERCVQWLKPEGKASFILPIAEGEQFIKIAQSLGLQLQRRCLVKPTQAKAANRSLFELARSTVMTDEQRIVIRNNGQYSEEFTALTKEFYLKM